MEYPPIDNEFKREVNYYMSLLKRGYVKEEYISKIEGLLKSRGFDAEPLTKEFRKKLEEQEKSRKAEEMRASLASQRYDVMKKIPKSIEDRIEGNRYLINELDDEAPFLLKENFYFIGEFCPYEDLADMKGRLREDARDYIANLMCATKQERYPANVTYNVLASLMVACDREIFKMEEDKDENALEKTITFSVNSEIIPALKEIFKKDIVREMESIIEREQADKSWFDGKKLKITQNDAYKIFVGIVERYGVVDNTLEEVFSTLDKLTFEIAKPFFENLIAMCARDIIEDIFGYELS